MKIMHYITLFIWVTTFSQSAHAYLDPGTGSFILQLLIAGIMGALYTLKLYWYGVKAFVFKILGKEIKQPLMDEPYEDESKDLKE